MHRGFLTTLMMQPSGLALWTRGLGRVAPLDCAYNLAQVSRGVTTASAATQHICYANAWGGAPDAASDASPSEPTATYHHTQGSSSSGREPQQAAATSNLSRTDSFGICTAGNGALLRPAGWNLASSSGAVWRIPQQRHLTTETAAASDLGQQEAPGQRIDYQKRHTGDGPATAAERHVQKLRSERRRVVGTSPEAYIAVRFPVRLHGVSPLALRSDIQHLLRDCNARLENIRAEYDAKMVPRVWWVDLDTAEDQQRALAWNGSYLGARSVNITRGDPRDMKCAILSPLAMGSRGRYVLLDGIQDNANLEDIVRHFEGFALMGNPVTLVREGVDPSQKLGRVGTPSLTRHTPTDQQLRYKALIRFQTHAEACRAVRERHGGYLLNLPVKLRVLP